MSPDSSIHRQAWDLIPWIVNGTADAPDRAAIETHLSQCEQCREELQFQRTLRATMTAEPTVTASEVDAGDSWERLRVRLDRDALPTCDESPVGASESVGTSGSVDAAESRVALPGVNASSRWPRSGWTAGWVAAAALEAVALGALGMAIWSKSRPPEPAAWAPAYRTLSDLQTVPAAATIRVVLDARTTLAQLQALLERSGLQIVSGPSPAGVWSLAPSSASGRSATEAALRSLRADPLVRFAEPLDTAP